MWLYYNRTRMTPLWGVLAAIALAWPDRVAGPLDGIPLDKAAEALLVAAVFPALWCLHPRFLTTRLAHAAILALALFRIGAALAFTQQGWCVRFEPALPYVWDQTGAPHAWDLRADWRSPDPVCSAIMTRPYESFADFPVWFFNLPPANENWPGPLDRPPGATTRMTVRGFVNAREPGTLRFERGGEVAATMSVDGSTVAAETGAVLEPGVHLVALDAVLTGEHWRLVPTWNGRDFWAEPAAAFVTARRPDTTDARFPAWLRWVPAALTVVLLGGWIAAAVRGTRDRLAVAWTIVTSSIVAALVLADRVDAARWVIAALAIGAALPFGATVRNLRGTFLLVGVPWLTFVAACALPAVGHIVIYEWGNDYWMFQRFAYRIVMQGHWLEGGSATFWFQPLYRWIAGLLHVVFGDSSVGEWFWDGACLLVGGMFAFRVVRTTAGPRWALAAAVLPLAIFVLGTPRYLIGRGLSEISSAGFVYLAALLAMRSRGGSIGAAVLAGVCGTLAFYTRLNNLPMAFGAAAFAWAPSRWRSALVIVATIAMGVLLFALRTWRYAGVFSVFYGTQRDLLAIWQVDRSIAESIRRTIDSVSMVLSLNDPPRFDPRAVPVMTGAALAVAAVVRPRLLRGIPWRAVLLFFSGISGAFIARGSAYPGRFSMHIVPVTCAIFMCAAAHLLRRHDRRPEDAAAAAP